MACQRQDWPKHKPACQKVRTEQAAILEAITSDTPREDCLECTICLCSLEGKLQDVTAVRCGHVFHTRCIQSWAGVGKGCPICRQPMGLGNDTPIDSCRQAYSIIKQAYKEQADNVIKQGKRTSKRTIYNVIEQAYNVLEQHKML
eukprot:g15441.t1